MPLPTIHYLTGVHFRVGSVALLPEVLAELGVERPLVVTDHALQELRIVDRLDVKPAAVFADVKTNPDEELSLIHI